MARNQGLSFVPAKKRRKWPLFLWLLIFLLFISAAIVVVNGAVNKQLKTEEVKISILSLPTDLEGFTILHISDLHGAFLGDNQQQFFSAIEKATFHAVCITGDIVDPATGSSQAAYSLIKQIKAVQPQVPIYFVPGDEDPAPITTQGDGSSPYAPYIRELQAQGVYYVDVPMKLEVKKSLLWFVPKSQYTLDPDVLYESYQSQLQSTTASEGRQAALAYYSDQAQRLKEARKAMKVDDLQVLLSHYPLKQEEIATWHPPKDGSHSALNGIILSLAGHYNAGQWRLPFINRALYVPEKGFFPDDQGITGLHKVSSVPQYISPGIGSSAFYPFKGRLFNGPTITFLSLTRRY